MSANMSEQINPRIYKFYDVPACNMCGTATQSAHVIGFRVDRRAERTPRQTQGIGVSVSRCAGCGLHFANPQPRPNALSDHYGMPPEAYWKENSFKPDPNYFGRQIEVAKSLLKANRPLRALDIGVGLGKAVIAMRAAGMDVWGIEPSEPFHRRALETTGLDADRLQCTAVEDAEFREGSFDFVTFGAVLEHVYDPAGAIQRTIKWLRPGGIWQAEVPSSDHLVSRLINAYFRARGTSYVTNLSPMHPPFHIHEFTLASFEKLAARTKGFEIAERYYDVATIYHLPRIMHPVLRRVMERTDTGMQLTVWLRRT